MICDTAGPNESEAPLVTVWFSNSWPREVELFEFEPECVYRFASGHYGPKEHGEKLTSETSVRIGKLAHVAETTGRDSTGDSGPPVMVLAKRNTGWLNQWSTCKTTGLNEMGALLIVACLGAVFQHCFSLKDLINDIKFNNLHVKADIVQKFGAVWRSLGSGCCIQNCAVSRQSLSTRGRQGASERQGAVSVAAVQEASFEILVKTQLGGNIPLNVWPGESMKFVKAEIVQKSGNPVECIMLGRQELDDNDKVGDSGIDKSSILTVASRVRGGMEDSGAKTIPEGVAGELSAERESEVRENFVDALTSFADAKLLAEVLNLSSEKVMGFVGEAVAAQKQQEENSTTVPLMIEGCAQLDENYTSGDFRRAVIKGDGTEVQKWLDAGINPNASEEMESGWTPLHFAAQAGHRDIVNALLRKGADSMAVDKNGETPLMQACYWGFGSLMEDLAKKTVQGTVDGLELQLQALPKRHAEERQQLVDSGGAVKDEREQTALGKRQEEERTTLTQELQDAKAHKGRHFPAAVSLPETMPPPNTYGPGFMSVLCSAPEYSLPTDTPRTDLPDRFTFKRWGDNEPEWRRNKYSAEVMVGLFALCDEFGDFVNFGYDWAGSSTAEPADLDPERRVRACCMSLGCSCGSARSTKIIKGAVDWSDPKSVAGSLWFPKYFTKVMGAIQAAAQRPGIKYIEMVVIAGGPVRCVL